MPFPAIGLGAGILGAAGIGALGSVITSAFNVGEARRAQRLQMQMSNTEMQRRRRDLEAAGLNPMLALGHGMQGASSPQMQAGRADAPHIDPMIFAQMDHARAQTARELAEVGKLKSETQFLNESLEDRLLMQHQQLLHELEKKDLTSQQRDEIQAHIVKLEKEFQLMDVQREHSALDLDRMRAESSMYKTLGGFGVGALQAGKAGLLRIPTMALRRLKGVSSAKGLMHRGLPVRQMTPQQRRLDESLKKHFERR